LPLPDAGNQRVGGRIGYARGWLRQRWPLHATRSANQWPWTARMGQSRRGLRAGQALSFPLR
jgi:hypothetical protein